MDWSSAVYSVSSGKSETPLLHSAQPPSRKNNGAVESLVYNCIKDCCSFSFFFQLYLVTPPNKMQVFFFEALQVICFRYRNSIEGLWIPIIFLEFWAP